MLSRRGTRSVSSSTTQLDGDTLARVLGVIRELTDVVREQVTHVGEP